MTAPQRILVIRLSAMGDVAMCVPVLLAFKKAYPQVEIVTLSRKHTNHILSQITGITVVEARVQDQHSGIYGLWKLAKELRAQHITAIADLHNVLRSKILRFFMKNLAQASLDKGRGEKAQLVNDPTFFKQLPHTTARYAAVFKNLGYEVKLDGTDFLPKIPLHATVKELLTSKPVKRIGIAPFAAHAPKSLTVQRASELIWTVSKLPNVEVLLFGGGTQESKDLQELSSLAEHVVSIAGKVTFIAELSALANLDCMIAMDSGNGHLAAMYGVPVITIWGNTHPFAGFAPYGQPQENQITLDKTKFPKIPTSVFGNKEVAGYEIATDSFDQDKVMRRLKAILKE